MNSAANQLQTGRAEFLIPGRSLSNAMDAPGWVLSTAAAGGWDGAVGVGLELWNSFHWARPSDSTLYLSARASVCFVKGLLSFFARFRGRLRFTKSPGRVMVPLSSPFTISATLSSKECGLMRFLVGGGGAGGGGWTSLASASSEEASPKRCWREDAAAEGGECLNTSGLGEPPRIQVNIAILSSMSRCSSVQSFWCSGFLSIHAAVPATLWGRGGTGVAASAADRARPVSEVAAPGSLTAPLLTPPATSATHLSNDPSRGALVALSCGRVVDVAGDSSGPGSWGAECQALPFGSR
jgi:hypothetical protein